MAQNSTGQVFSDRIKYGCFPAARIYCIGKKYCDMNAHIALTARCPTVKGAITNLSYGFSVEEHAPSFTFQDTGSGNATNTSLHQYVYWLHGYEHLDKTLNDANAPEANIAAMCENASKELNYENKLMVNFFTNNEEELDNEKQEKLLADKHEELVEHLCSDVFKVQREDVVLLVASTVQSLMYLYQGKMKIAYKTTKTTSFSELVAAEAGVLQSVDLYNGIMESPDYDESDDPLSLKAETGKEWVTSNLLSRLIHDAYINVHATAFNMLNDVDECRRLLLMVGQSSTFKGRKSKITGFKGRDPVGNHKEAIVQDMIDRVALAAYLGGMESYNETSATAFYKNWSLQSVSGTAEGLLLAQSQKASTAPFLAYAYNCPLSVGVGFKCVLKTPEDLAKEKALIDKTQDVDKEQKKATKDLNQIKFVPGPTVNQTTVKRIIPASGFSPHLVQYACEVLNFANDAARGRDGETMHRSSHCNACGANNPDCYCRAIPKKVSASCNSSYAGGNGFGKFTGMFLVSNKPQTFGDMEQKPYNVNATDEELAESRKLKPSSMIQESLSRLPPETKSLIDLLLRDPLGDAFSLAARAQSIANAAKDNDGQGKRPSKLADFTQTISALKSLYNSLHQAAMEYSQSADESLRTKCSMLGPNACKHLLQTSFFLGNYSPFGPACMVLAMRTFAFFFYATVAVFLCEEILKNQSKLMNKFVKNDPLLDPTLPTIAKGYMTKNFTVKAEMNNNAPEQCSLLRINQHGESEESLCSQLQTVNVIKPISVKQNLFSNSFSEEEKTGRKLPGVLGTLVGNGESSNLFSDVDVMESYGSSKSNRQLSIPELMKPSQDIPDDSKMNAEKGDLLVFLPVFAEHDADKVFSFFSKIFNQSEQELKIRIAKIRHQKSAKRVEKLLGMLVEEEVITNLDQMQCLAKYAWLMGRGKKSLSTGKLPISCDDLANCLFENLVTASLEERNEAFPLNGLNKSMPFVSTVDIRGKNTLLSCLTATGSLGLAMAKQPLLLGNLSYFAFISRLGPILRCGINGLDTSLLNDLRKTNIDPFAGLKDASKQRFVVYPTENNFTPARQGSDSVGLRADSMQEITERLQECYTEDMVVNVLAEMLNAGTVCTQKEAEDEMQFLLDEYCDLFDSKKIVDAVLSKSKKRLAEQAFADNAKELLSQTNAPESKKMKSSQENP